MRAVAEVSVFDIGHLLDAPVATRPLWQGDDRMRSPIHKSATRSAEKLNSAAIVVNRFGAAAEGAFTCRNLFSRG